MSKLTKGSGRRFGVATAIGGMLIAATAAVVPGATTAQTGPPWMDSSRSPEDRTELLLAAMDLEDKATMVTGDAGDFSCGFRNAPIPEFEIPEMCMADGPVGVRFGNTSVENREATALPAAIALAATWDPAQAARYGDLIGEEAFKTGHSVQLGPSLDIARVPFGARNGEAFGEDPLIAGEMATEVAAGIQNHPVLADLKHVAVNNQETFRSVINVDVDERALQEIYMRPYGTVIDRVDVGSAMCAFPRINTTWACENENVMTNILKDQLGFKGFILTDFGANHSTDISANAGLDFEAPGIPIGEFWDDALVDAVNNGLVSIDRVDDMVRRMLLPMFKGGLFDNLPERQEVPVAEHGQIAREIGADSLVLLKNDNGVLPLSSDSGDSIAVIGPDADNASAAVGGSSLVFPAYTVGAVEAITARAGAGVEVQYAPGTDPITAGDMLPGPTAVPSSVLTPAVGGPGDVGLYGEYWTNLDFAGVPTVAQTDLQVNLAAGFLQFGGLYAGSPKVEDLPQQIVGNAPDDVSVRWTGQLTAPNDGDYTLALTNLGSAQLYVDGELVLDSPGVDVSTQTVTVPMVADTDYDILIEYRTDSPLNTPLDRAHIRFGWEPAPGVVPAKMQEAVELAAESDVAVVVVRTYESEANLFDRPQLTMPNGQDQLIREVSAVNPNTIVVLQSGTPVAMQSWVDQTPAIIAAWYGGQEQGNAIADVLFGDVNPSGKLPVTFPVNEESIPVTTPEQFPGIISGCSVDDAPMAECTISYTEGVMVGYRGYTNLGIEPQFAFGHGLSYTTFDYSDLRIRSRGQARISATVTVTNTGPVAGSEVVQAYVGELPTDVVETAPLALAGFGKVYLEPGESKRVALELDRKSLSYWDSYTDAWVTPRGNVDVSIGSASDDARLSDTVRVKSNDREGRNGIDRRQTYSLVNRASDACLDAANWGTSNGTVIQQWACPASQPNAEFTLRRAGRDSYRIENVNAGKVLDVTDVSTADGAPLQLWEWARGDNQRFELIRVGEGYYQLVAKHSGKCVTVENGSVANGARIIQLPCDAANPAQAFALQRAT